MFNVNIKFTKELVQSKGKSQMTNLTKNQIEQLKQLVMQRSIEHKQENRFVMEAFVRKGLAYRNKGATEVESNGPQRQGIKRIVERVYYAPTKEAFAELADAEKELESRKQGIQLREGEEAPTPKKPIIRKKSRKQTTVPSMNVLRVKDSLVSA